MSNLGILLLEARDVTKMDRLQSQQDNAENREMMARNAKMAANQEMIGAVGTMATSLTGPDMMTGQKGKLFG